MDQPRNSHVPNTMADIVVRLRGLGWHGPISVVGAPRTTAFGGGARDGYAFEAPRPARCAGALWGRGIPGTRALARVAARCTSSTAF